MNINQTPTPQMGKPNGGQSDFAKITSTSGNGYIPNDGSVVLLFKQAWCQINIVCGDILNAEVWQNGFTVPASENSDAYSEPITPAP